MVLVTGATGFLGSHLLMELLNRDQFLVVRALFRSQESIQNTAQFFAYYSKSTYINRIEWVEADILEIPTLAAAFVGITHVYHCAALVSFDPADEEKLRKTNIEGTFNLLNACVKNGIKKFVYTSTTSIYGKSMVDDEKAVWVDESLFPDPRDIYDITKLTAELLCRDYFEKEAIETTILRVSRFLPENDNTKAIHRLYRGLDEEDGAIAHILALEKHFQSFQIYNISNQSPFQKEDLSILMRDPKSVIEKYYPQAEDIFAQKGWVFPSKIDRVYSIEKAKRELGYQPKNNFDSFL